MRRGDVYDSQQEEDYEGDYILKYLSIAWKIPNRSDVSKPALKVVLIGYKNCVMRLRWVGSHVFNRSLNFDKEIVYFSHKTGEEYSLFYRKPVEYRIFIWD